MIKEGSLHIIPDVVWAPNGGWGAEGLGPEGWEGRRVTTCWPQMESRRDPQTELGMLEHARLIAKHHGGRWTTVISNWNPAVSNKQKKCRTQGRLAKGWEDDIKRLPTTDQNQ